MLVGSVPAALQQRAVLCCAVLLVRESGAGSGMSVEERAAALPPDHFLTLLPGAAVRADTPRPASTPAHARALRVALLTRALRCLRRLLTPVWSSKARRRRMLREFGKILRRPLTRGRRYCI